MTDKAYYEKGFDIVSARERFLGKREMCERYVIRFFRGSKLRRNDKSNTGKRHRAGISLCTYAQRSLCEPVTLADAGCSFRGS